jgi:homoserine O-acetyltransferase
MTPASAALLGPHWRAVRSGQLLDENRYYIVMVDNIGHGKSSKPSDGMRAHFPHDYEDMVHTQYDLLTQGPDVNHLRLILGTLMGCMHSWVWGETYPTLWMR